MGCLAEPPGEGWHYFILFYVIFRTAKYHAKYFLCASRPLVSPRADGQKIMKNCTPTGLPPEALRAVAAANKGGGGGGVQLFLEPHAGGEWRGGGN